VVLAAPGRSAQWLHDCIVISWQTLRAQPQARDSYPVFREISTRWSDNDVYGHVNNVIYYSWFDTAVNAYLIEQGALDIHDGQTISLVIETQCNYFASLAFPPWRRYSRGPSGQLQRALRSGSVCQGASQSAAAGHFVHVYVDRQTRRPVPLPEPLRAALQPICCTELAGE
jgi:acyl-CoA thioester hydrolase